jgi:conjugal transfer pilus assembly protein TraW
MKQRYTSIYLLLITAFYLLSLSMDACARDLGKYGQSFTIAEKPFIQMLKSKLEQIDVQKEQKKMQEQARESAENPKPVSGIFAAREDRTWLHDPSFTLEQDAILPDGKVIHKAGTKVNPLDHMNLNRRLFFIDAREDIQIDWLKEQLADLAKEEELENRIILFAGSPLKLKEELREDVYFDQSGELSRKFGIKASPALLVQEGNQLKIMEVYLSKEGQHKLLLQKE